MSVVARLAARNAWAGRSRSAMTVFAVALSVAFMSAVLMLTGGMSSQSNSGVAVAYQHASVVVHGDRVQSNPPGEFLLSSGAPVRAATLDAVRAIPGVSDAQGLRSGYAVLEHADGTLVGTPGTGGGVGQSWLGNDPLNPYRLLAGHGPDAPGQVALDQAAAAQSGVTLGQHLTLVTAVGKHAAIVVGIVAYGSASGPFDTTAVLLPEDQTESLLGTGDTYDQILVAATPRAESAVAHAAAAYGAQGQTGASWIAAEQSAVNTTLSFGRFLLYGFALVALLAGGALISNTFTVTVAQRTRELALARALGATRRQMRAAVLGEAALIGLVASLFGTFLGMGVTALIRTVFSWLHLTLFNTHAAVTASSLAVPLAVGAAVTMAAAFAPAARAARMAPIAALREPQIDESGRSKLRAVAGFILVALGAAGAVTGVSGKSNTLALAGLAALLIGAITAGPVLVAGLGRILAAPLRRIAGPPGQLSGRALSRNSRRSAATAGVLMVGIMLMAFATSLVSSMNQATSITAAKGVRANYVVTTASPWQWQVSDNVAHLVSEAPGVTATAAVYAAPALEDGASVVVGTADPGQIAQLWNFGWTTGSLASLTGDQIAVQKSAMQGQRVGDTRTLTLADGSHQTVRIAAVYDNGFTGFDAPTYLISPALFHAHMAQPGAELLLIDGAHTSTSAISAALGGDHSVIVHTAAGWVAQGNTKVGQLANLSIALEVMAVLIAFAGITNTMALAVRERWREFGILRAVGALPRQLGRMIVTEAAVLAAYGTAVGTLLGVAGSWALVKSSTSSDLSIFAPPAGRLGIIAAASVQVTVVLTAIPARIARRTPVLQATVNE